MTVRILITCFVLALPVLSHAQQEPAYSFFMYNGLAINPAVAGSAETFSATAMHRRQWSGIEGAPETQTLNVDALAFQEKIGLGLSVINDRMGVVQQLSVNAQYSYRIRFERSTLSLGLQAGVNNYQADYSSVRTNPGGSLDQSFSVNTNRMIFNFGSGVFYYSEKFFAGLSVPHILTPALDGMGNNDDAVARQYRHYFVNAGYVVTLSERFKVKPSALLKVAEGAPVQFDINSNFWYNDMLSVGFSYRTNDSFTTLFQVQWKQFRAGFAYDYITSSLSRFATGNNEIMLRYEMPKKNKRILTPRYF